VGASRDQSIVVEKTDYRNSITEKKKQEEFRFTFSLKARSRAAG
jgi:hypothetical protein